MLIGSHVGGTEELPALPHRISYEIALQKRRLEKGRPLSATLVSGRVGLAPADPFDPAGGTSPVAESARAYSACV